MPIVSVSDEYNVDGQGSAGWCAHTAMMTLGCCHVIYGVKFFCYLTLLQ